MRWREEEWGKEAVRNEVYGSGGEGASGDGGPGTADQVNTQCARAATQQKRRAGHT